MTPQKASLIESPDQEHPKAHILSAPKNKHLLTIIITQKTHFVNPGGSVDAAPKIAPKIAGQVGNAAGGGSKKKE